MQTYYENFKNNNRARLQTRVLDPKGLLTGNGYGVEGVYSFAYVNSKLGVEIPAYIGQAGVIANAPSYVASDVYERILQHLKRFLGGKYYTYWTGLEDNEDWKIKIDLLCSEPNHSKRLQAETEYIEKIKPFLQDTQNGTYDLYPTKYGYSRNDLCLHPWTRTDKGEDVGQRRVAFLARLAEIMPA